MTICVKCKNHYYDGVFRFCMAHSIPPDINPVTGRDMRSHPYVKCDKINIGGKCPDYEERPPSPPKLKWWKRLLGVGS